MWILFLKLLWIKNPYNKTPYDFTAECALRQHFQTNKKNLLNIERPEKHIRSWFYLKNKSAQTQPLCAFY